MSADEAPGELTSFVLQDDQEELYKKTSFLDLPLDVLERMCLFIPAWDILKNLRLTSKAFRSWPFESEDNYRMQLSRFYLHRVQGDEEVVCANIGSRTTGSGGSGEGLHISKQLDAGPVSRTDLAGFPLACFKGSWAFTWRAILAPVSCAWMHDSQLYVKVQARSLDCGGEIHVFRSHCNDIILSRISDTIMETMTPFPPYITTVDESKHEFQCLVDRLYSEGQLHMLDNSCAPVRPCPFCGQIFVQFFDLQCGECQRVDYVRVCGYLASEACRLQAQLVQGMWELGLWDDAVPLLPA
jgi:hypothetical protein